MHVCLVRPPSIVSPTAYVASLTPPIGIAYLCAALEDAGHEVTLIDAVGERPLQSTATGDGLLCRGLTFDEVIERIPVQCELIGVSCMFSAEWIHIRELVRRIGRARPDALLVGGGEHFTAAPELSFEQCPELDLCVLGEGEEAIVEVADRHATGATLAEVVGLCLRDESGVRRTSPRRRIRAIDDIRPPAWSRVPLDAYFDNNLTYGVDRGRSMPMLASRGCPYHCTFCSNDQMWQARWFVRSPLRVVEEIEEYVRRYDIRNVDFYDLTAIVRKDWIVEFCKLLVERGVDITWQLPSGTRSEAIDAEVARWLYRSGCRNLNYAPESGSARTLAAVRKKVKLPALLKSLRASVCEGLNVKLNIIIGLPDETDLDIWRTLWLLVRLSLRGAHDVSIGVFAPYPGSVLYERLVEEGRITHSDEYWSTLAYVDISETESYCAHVPSWRLRLYNWLGFGLFYGSNYLFRPWRAARTVWNLARGRHESRGEMALVALATRWQQSLRLRRRRVSSTT